MREEGFTMHCTLTRQHIYKNVSRTHLAASYDYEFIYARVVYLSMYKFL